MGLLIATTNAEKFAVGEHLTALCVIISSNLSRIPIVEIDAAR